jgi:hypothetical protein
VPAAPLSRELAEQAVAALDAASGNQTNAAKALGVPRGTFQNRLKAAARYGLRGFKPVPEGFEVSGISSGPNGEFVRMRPERSHGETVPEGHVVAGVSTLLDEQGRVALQWVKTKQGTDEASIVEAVRAAFDDYNPPITPFPLRDVRDDLLTVIPLPDLHIGLLAWEEETGGNYDTHIARETMRVALADLVESMPPSKHCLILGLGDLLHFDGYEARTERSGNPLDTDSRYPKVLREALRLVKYTIDLCLLRHGHVEVRLMAGNHDTKAALAVALALSEGYAGDERVTIDDSPAYIWFKRYGKVLLGATHGDKAKPEQMPLLMAVDRPHDWAASTRRRVFTGHVHHERLREIGGVIVETLRAPVAKDAYHSFEGYRAGRSFYGYTFWTDGSRMAKQEFEL